MNQNYDLPPSGFTFIYTLSDEQGVRYVGKTNNLLKRLRKHLTEAKLKRSIREKWIYNKLQANTGIMIEVLDIVPESEWAFYETYWISQFRAWGFNLVNGTDGGEGSNGFQGRRHTEETKELLRAKRKLQPPVQQMGETNGRAKLTQALVDEIREKDAKGECSRRALSRAYGVAPLNIKKIIDRVYWK